MLSRLLDALMARRDVPDGLRAWAERAAAAGFASLGECLDELELTGTDAAAATGAEPPGLSGIFADDELDAMERAATRVPGRWRRIATGVAGAVVAALVGLALVDPGAHAERADRPSGPATVPVTALTSTADPAPRRTHRAPAKPHRHRGTTAHRRRAHRPRTSTTAAAPPSPTPPVPAAPAAPAQSSGGPTVLPAPGGTTLPGP
jgi:hypothetical protein